VKSYHDRFVLVDNQRCWHFGAPIKDAGAKAFLISEIQSPGLVSAVVLDIQTNLASSKPSRLEHLAQSGYVFRLCAVFRSARMMD
jgi:hypothetical protein